MYVPGLLFTENTFGTGHKSVLCQVLTHSLSLFFPLVFSVEETKTKKWHRKLENIGWTYQDLDKWEHARAEFTWHATKPATLLLSQAGEGRTGVNKGTRGLKNPSNNFHSSRPYCQSQGWHQLSDVTRHQEKSFLITTFLPALWYSRSCYVQLSNLCKLIQSRSNVLTLLSTGLNRDTTPVRQ